MNYLACIVITLYYEVIDESNIKNNKVIRESHGYQDPIK
jgi:hypothetical protein